MGEGLRRRGRRGSGSNHTRGVVRWVVRPEPINKLQGRAREKKFKEMLEAEYCSHLKIILN